MKVAIPPSSRIPEISTSIGLSVLPRFGLPGSPAIGPCVMDPTLDSSSSPARDRLLDANLDRAREGLRVLEDWARFGLDRGDLVVRTLSQEDRIPEFGAVLDQGRRGQHGQKAGLLVFGTHGQGFSG